MNIQLRLKLRTELGSSSIPTILGPTLGSFTTSTTRRTIHPTNRARNPTCSSVPEASLPPYSSSLASYPASHGGSGPSRQVSVLRFSGICPRPASCRHHFGPPLCAKAPPTPTRPPVSTLLLCAKSPLITHSLVFFAVQPSLRVDPQTGQFGCEGEEPGFSKMWMEKPTFFSSA